MKKFKLNAVLAVYHDKLMCSFEEQRELIDFMAGEKVYLWDIPPALKLCKASLDKQYSWLKKHQLEPNSKPDAYPKFVREVIKQSGVDSVNVKPLKKGIFKARPGTETL